jgi:hypothetical protein
MAWTQEGSVAFSRPPAVDCAVRRQGARAFPAGQEVDADEGLEALTHPCYLGALLDVARISGR